MLLSYERAGDRDSKISYAGAGLTCAFAGGAATTHLISSLDGERSVWQNNPSHGDNAATARSTETYRLRKIAGESEVSRSETFVSWVLKRCGYTNTPATIYLI